jgi:hypothetical protein
MMFPRSESRDTAQGSTLSVDQPHATSTKGTYGDELGNSEVFELRCGQRRKKGN